MWKAVRAYVLWTNASIRRTQIERNRSTGFGLVPHCAEIMQEYYIVAGKKLKAVIEQTNITEYKHYNLGTNFGIFITVSTKSLRSLNLHSINFLITFVTKTFFGTNTRNKFSPEAYCFVSSLIGFQSFTRIDLLVQSRGLILRITICRPISFPVSVVWGENRPNSKNL